MSSKFLDKTGLDTLWAKIKSTFQTLGNLVTAWGSTPSDTKYPSEKLVKTSLDAKAPNAPSEVTIANGDKMLIADSSDSGKVKRASVSFDGSTTGQFLTKKGTFGQVLYADEGWGGAFRTSLSPFDNYAFKNANVFFGPKPSAIRVEYSNDGGTTWTDYGLTDEQKQDLFSQYGSVSVSCGKSLHVHPGYTGTTTAAKDLSDENVADQRLRITICNCSLANEGTTGTTDTWIYCNLRRIGIYMSTQSAGNGAHCLFERRTGANFKSGIDTWNTVGDYKIQGDSGWNSIPCTNDAANGGFTFGTGDSQYRQVRFTIWSDKLSASPHPSQTGDMRIYKVVAYSELMWTNASSNPSLGSYSAPYTINSSTGVSNFSKGITSGVAIPISSGGTGKTTAKAAQNALLSNMNSVNTDAPSDANLVFKYASPTDTDGAIFTRPLSKIWTWIKGKLSSDSNVNISGNAATATALASGSADRTKLDGIAEGAEVNVQSDWNQTTSTADDYIKNKPQNLVQDASYVHTDNNYTTADRTKLDSAVQPGDLATVATSGDYDDLSNKPTIPAAQVQSDWAQTDSSAVDYIKNKPSAVMWLTYDTSYTNEQISGWLASGYLLCVSYMSKVYVYAKGFIDPGSHNYFFVDAQDYAYLRASIGSSTCTWSEGDNYPAYVKYLEGTVSSARDTMTVSKDSSNQTVVSSGDGTTAAPVYIRPKGHTAADNQFVVHEDGSISLNKFHSRFGYIEHHMYVANEKVIRFGFSRTASNVAHRDSCIRLQYARNVAPFEVRIAINIIDSGTLEGIGATVTVCNSVISVNAPKVYSYSNANWHWVFVAFSRVDANIDHYLNWEYSGENSDGLKVDLVEVVNSYASAVPLRFIPIGNVNVDSGSFTGIGSATRPVYVNSSGQIVECNIFYA